MIEQIRGTVESRRFLARLRYQLGLGLFVAVLMPFALYNVGVPSVRWTETSTINTGFAALIAFLFALYLFRRFMSFPGVGVLGYVMPAVSAGYVFVVVALLAFRIEYSRLTLLLGFMLAMIFLFIVAGYVRRKGGQRFYIVPGGSAHSLLTIPRIDWVILEKPTMPQEASIVLVADLRADLAEGWERLIADAAIRGYPVYHVKQIQESLTGKVEIEHLSENSFGSLLPNLGYRRFKRILDFLTAAIAIPLLAVPMMIVAIAIKWDSSGPVFFRQRRQGYRGEHFTVIKFRTMSIEIAEVGDARMAAITRPGDARITRLGKWLRKTRIDELPQLFNVLAGHMSLIGPRPEALSLSEWYLEELPFYNYRHIVRPGITGWAQVNQGHVAALDDVLIKLHYDFFYIKNYSAWLDLLIVARTLSIMTSGAGAR